MGGSRAIPEDNWDDGWLDPMRPSTQSMVAPPLIPSQDLGSWEDLVTDVESEDTNGSTATDVDVTPTMQSQKATPSTSSQDLRSWEELVTDVESEVDANCSTVTD